MAAANPFGGEGDMLLIAEEMGIGLGARFAGLAGPDPGPIFEDTAAHAKVYASGRSTPMWSVPDTGDRAVFLGEARGMWLWVVLWPHDAAHLIYEDLVLTDLRDAGSRDRLDPGRRPVRTVDRHLVSPGGAVPARELRGWRNHAHRCEARVGSERPRRARGRPE